MPLLIGCALLLLFVIVLGNLSVRRVEDTSREVLHSGTTIHCSGRPFFCSCGSR
jgi:hypothetical protein